MVIPCGHQVGGGPLHPEGLGEGPVADPAIILPGPSSKHDVNRPGHEFPGQEVTEDSPVQALDSLGTGNLRHAIGSEAREGKLGIRVQDRIRCQDSPGAGAEGHIEIGSLIADFNLTTRAGQRPGVTRLGPSGRCDVITKGGVLDLGSNRQISALDRRRVIRAHH